MACCYLYVVSYGLARVILPDPILDRSGGSAADSVSVFSGRKYLKCGPDDKLLDCRK